MKRKTNASPCKPTRLITGMICFIIALLISSVAMAQKSDTRSPADDNCAPGLETLNEAIGFTDPTNGFAWNPPPEAANDPSINCNSDGYAQQTIITPSGKSYRRSNCTAWAYYRSKYDGTGDGGQWSTNLPTCSTSPDVPCYTFVPAVGTLMITLPNTNGASKPGHVAVVECAEPGDNPDWVWISEYNYHECEYGVRRISGLREIQKGATPYRFIYPDNGKPAKLELPYDCSAPAAIRSAKIKPLDESASRAEVTIKTKGPICPQEYLYFIERKITAPDGRETHPVQPSPIQSFQDKIGQPQTEIIDGLDPCSKIEYMLYKFNIANHVMQQVDKQDGFNLPAVTITGVVFDGKKAIVSWNPICSNLQDKRITYHCMVSRPYNSQPYPSSTSDNFVVLYGDGYPLYANMQFTFTVRAHIGIDSSAVASTTFTTPSNLTAPPQPLPPTVMHETSCRTMNISWTPIENDIASGISYVVKIYYRATASAATKLVKTISMPAGTTAVDHPLATTDLDGIYTFTVATKKGTVVSKESTATKVLVDCLAEPLTITNKTTAACKGVTLTYTFKAGTNPDKTDLKYIAIYRKVKDGSFELVDKVMGNVIKPYTDVSAPNGVVATYHLRAVYNTTGESESSNEVAISALAPPLPPSDVLLRTEGYHIFLTFTDRTEDEIKFEVQQSLNPATGFGDPHDAPASYKSGQPVSFNYFMDSKRAQGNTMIYFKVLAVRSSTCKTIPERIPSTKIPILRTPQVTAAEIKDGAVTISWNDGAGTYTNGYEVERQQKDGTGWELVYQNETRQEKTWRDPRALIGEGYSYRVRSYYKNPPAGNSYSEFSTPFSCRPASTSCAATLAAPVLGSVRSADDSVFVSFEDKSINENGFMMEYRYGGFDTWYTASIVQSVPGSTLGEKIIMSRFPSEIGKSITVRVRAYSNNVGFTQCVSEPSTTVTKELIASPPHVYAVGNASSITVSWKSIYALAVYKYEVSYRKATSGTWIPITRGTSRTSQEHTPIEYVQDYFYRLRTVYEATNKPISVSKWVYTSYPVRVTPAPTPPTVLVGKDIGNAVELTWKPGAYNDEYVIERFTKSNPTANYVEIVKDLNANITTYIDKPLTPDIYVYRVKAKNRKGVSAYSNLSTVTVQANGLYAVVVDNNSVRLSWKLFEGASSYLLQKYVGTKWTDIPEVTSPYMDKGLAAGLHKYRVKVLFPSGKFIYTNEVTGKVFTSTEYRAAEVPTTIQQGIEYQYYEHPSPKPGAQWEWLPEFDFIVPVKSGVQPELNLSNKVKDGQMAFRFTGWIHIDKKGDYTFTTITDDGSKLYIGNNQVVDNDGYHARQSKSGSIKLMPGKHSITITYFNRDGGIEFDIQYFASHMSSKMSIPKEKLFCKKPPTSAARMMSSDSEQVYIEDNAELGELVSVYPNPASNVLVVEVNDTAGSTVELDLIDLVGNRVASLRDKIEVKGKPFLMPVSAIKDGIYILSIRVGNQSASKKVVISRE